MYIEDLLTKCLGNSAGTNLRKWWVPVRVLDAGWLDLEFSCRVVSVPEDSGLTITGKSAAFFNLFVDLTWIRAKL